MEKFTHFKGKDAITHVAEAQAKGIISSIEIHGTEVPGHLSAGADASRDTAIVLLFVWVILFFLSVDQTLIILGIFGLGWTIWKTGRSAWLGWSRLERLHRVLEQERWEIKHNRTQEREELKALYASKGLEGQLLEDVLDVLMADDERLLKVMVEEELGLSLESQEHPLKQAIGAFVGSIIGLLFCSLGLILWPAYGIIFASLILIGASSGLTAYYAENRVTPAIVWIVGLGALAFGFVFFLAEYLLGMP